MQSSDFDQAGSKAFRRVPPRFRKRLHNVAILVEQEPPPRYRGLLLGFIRGPAAALRSSFEGFSMPDRITLFQGPIERAARGPNDVPRVIAETLWHEIAHYFGMDEPQVRAAERRRRSR